jgi:hypothetical protein
MKYTKLFIGAMLMASAVVASAADYNKTFTIDLSSENGVLTGSFGHAFTSTSDKNKTFLDTFNFNFSGMSDLDAAITSIASSTKLDLNITSFNLYQGTNLVASGDMISTGKVDLRTITNTGLGGGQYSLQVGGKILGTSGGSYGGNINVSPVPEPETWGMMVAGIGAVGFMSRRRKSGKVAA